MDWPTGIKPRGRGLEITIWGKGGKRIYSKILPGDPHKKSNIAAAVKHRKELMARKHLGIRITEDDRGQEDLADVAQRWIESLQIEPMGIKHYAKYLNLYWLPAFGDWPVTEITQADIKELLSRMDVKIKTQKNRLEPLRGVLDHAGVHPNPARGIRWPRAQTEAQKEPVYRYLPKERDKLIAALDKLTDKYASIAQDKPTRANKTKAHWFAQAKLYFPLLLAIGVRPGEALGLDWWDYDGEFVNVETQRSHSVEKEHTKTGRRRKVYVPQWIRPRLDAHPTQFREGAIFLGFNGESLKYTKKLNEAWAEAHRKARVRYRDPYTCRHTRAAELLSRGVTPAEAASQLGHSVQMFLDTYSEFIDEYADRRDMSQFEGAEASG